MTEQCIIICGIVAYDLYRRVVKEGNNVITLPVIDGMKMKHRG